MPTVKDVFRNFSNETTLHGFRRLWIGSRWRWPFWLFLIIAGLSLCIYQVTIKAQVLRANPLSININLVYKDEVEFPAITVCNTLKVRVSYLVNNTLLLNALGIIFPQGTNHNLTEKERNLMKKIDETWTTKEFFALAGIPKDQVILWCRLPNGEECSSDDFDPIITDEGLCFRFTKKLMVKEAGPESAMKLLLNLAQYERIPDTTPTGIRLVVQDRENHPQPSTGYDIMPGYQTAVVLRKAISKQLGNCQSDEKALKYYKKYTYNACRTEQALVEATLRCQCKVYYLPEVENADLTRNASIDDFPDCTMTEQFTCVERSMKDSAVVSNQSSYTGSSNSQCVGECVRDEYEKELYYNVFKDNLAYKGMIGLKTKIIQDAYTVGRDAGSYLNIFRHIDNDYKNIQEASNGLQELIVKKKLVPPFGTVSEQIVNNLDCMRSLLKEYNKDNSETRNALKNMNSSLPTNLIQAITELDPKLETLEISKTLKFANSLKKIHLDSCTNENQEICSLGALYDMLKIREQLEKKNDEIKSLMDVQIKNLTSLIETFVEENGTLNEYFKKTSDADKDELKKMLEYYVNQITFCLMETSRTFEKLLNNGQPSMKSKTIYNNFLNDLNYVNLTIFGTCKKGGLVMDSLFNATNRQELAFKIIHMISHGESSVQDTIKSLTFKSILMDFADELETKMSAQSYDMRLLNQSLLDIENMDQLLNKFVGQSNEETVRKSQLYEVLFTSNSPFAQGINHYKTVVLSHVNSLEEFFKKYIDKLISAYPGPEHDLSLIRAVLKNEDDLTANNTSESLPIFINQIMCLKKANFDLSKVAITSMDSSGLDSYKETVNTLVGSLKLYVDDIKSLKRFYEENLGLVNIYFADMGVKETTQERAYDFLSFLCDVGGVVGLWLGGSMLSLFETFDLLFLEHAASYCRCKKRLRQPSPSMNKADHFDLPVVLPHSPHTPLPMQPDNQVVQPFDIKPLNNGEADVYKPATWHLYYDKS